MRTTILLKLENETTEKNPDLIVNVSPGMAKIILALGVLMNHNNVVPVGSTTDKIYTGIEETLDI